MARIKLGNIKGPKGDPGPQGKSFTYNDFTPDQLNALKGPQGIQGPPGPAPDVSAFIVTEDLKLIINELKRLNGDS